MSRPTMLQTVQSNVKLSTGLRKAPKKRQDKKVHDSYTGIAIMAISVPVYAFTAFLAYQTRANPNLWVLGGGGLLGTAILVFGAIGSDKETFLPVFTAMVGSIIRVRKS